MVLVDSLLVVIEDQRGVFGYGDLFVGSLGDGV